MGRTKKPNKNKQLLIKISTVTLLVLVTSFAAYFIQLQIKTTDDDQIKEVEQISENNIIEEQAKEKVTIAKEKSEAKKKVETTEEAPVQHLRNGLITIVIDDVGYNIEQLKPFLELPFPVTFAILPKLAYSKKAAEILNKHEKEIILHQPVEPKGRQDPGPGTLYVGMNFAEVEQVLLDNLESLPKLVGANTHMGSKGTADYDLMSSFLQVLKNQNMFILDSKTTADSVISRQAEIIEIPVLQRSIFLDNQQEREAIIEAFTSGLETAKEEGHAVMIGHVWTNELAEILLELYPHILEEGYTLTDLSTVLLGVNNGHTWN